MVILAAMELKLLAIKKFKMAAILTLDWGEAKRRHGEKTEGMGRLPRGYMMGTDWEGREGGVGIKDG